MGPLTVHPGNPRYFADGDGRAILLTGSHTWTTVQDAGRVWPPPRFDFDAWVDWTTGHGHNFVRLWAWEQARWAPWIAGDFFFDPLPFARTGPGVALDGRPKFDVTHYDERYFGRLTERVGQAERRGVYVSVMLFQGWSVEDKPFTLGEGNNPWPGHPFHAANNVNGIDGDPRQTGHGVDTHTLRDPAITALQRAYIRRVIAAVNCFDNVLYEITNEDMHSDENTAWQYAMIDAIHEEEACGGRKRHPVLMTVPWPAPPSNELLFHSPAEAVSPSSLARYGTGRDDYCDDPPPADGRKVVLADTDHFWGIGGDAEWVWRSVLRGLNPIFMDPSGGDFVVHRGFDPEARQAMGVARRLSETLDLATLTPCPESASSRFALGGDGCIVAYAGRDEPVTVNLGGEADHWEVEWWHPVTGERVTGEAVVGGGEIVLVSPFPSGGVAVAARRGECVLVGEAIVR